MEITIGVFMPEDPQPEPEPLNVELDQSPGPNNETQEEDVGDFINRHVVERDSVFFEG